ncbi:unnamed protein product [Eruca vesicaria subsp. sativa]|uniref:Uncharacterized protein n=1 Tax=Eruca vesicaria subsp. sativa TaxID=29727 RepID=A0ABC8L1M0_ERUVS|nr:unnamed protein product [Eruca vesicaria subsp. sativa]
MTKKNNKKATTARELVVPVVEEVLSDRNNSVDFREVLSEGIKGQKRRCPSIIGGVSSRTRARKALSDGNEPIEEEAVQRDNTPVRETTVDSLSIDAESEGMSDVSSKIRPELVLLTGQIGLDIQQRQRLL